MASVIIAKSGSISEETILKEGGGGGGGGGVSFAERFECEFCGKLYSSSHSLRTHKKWHTGDLKHKCTFCEKKFRNPSELKRHEMTHTGKQ